MQIFRKSPRRANTTDGGRPVCVARLPPHNTAPILHCTISGRFKQEHPRHYYTIGVIIQSARKTPPADTFLWRGKKRELDSFPDSIHQTNVYRAGGKVMICFSFLPFPPPTAPRRSFIRSPTPITVVPAIDQYIFRAYRKTWRIVRTLLIIFRCIRA